jgi:hypothetical protein
MVTYFCPGWARLSSRERSCPVCGADLALRRIGGPEATAALGRLAADPSIIVRRAATLPVEWRAAR